MILGMFFYEGYLPIMDKKEGTPFFRSLKPEQLVKAVKYVCGFSNNVTFKLKKCHLSYALGDSRLEFSSKQTKELLDAFIDSMF